MSVWLIGEILPQKKKKQISCLKLNPNTFGELYRKNMWAREDPRGGRTGTEKGGTKDKFNSSGQLMITVVSLPLLLCFSSALP